MTLATHEEQEEQEEQEQQEVQEEDEDKDGGAGGRRRSASQRSRDLGAAARWRGSRAPPV